MAATVAMAAALARAAYIYPQLELLMWNSSEPWTSKLLSIGVVSCGCLGWLGLVHLCVLDRRVRSNIDAPDATWWRDFLIVVLVTPLLAIVARMQFRAWPVLDLVFLVGSALWGGLGVAWVVRVSTRVWDGARS